MGRVVKGGLAVFFLFLVVGCGHKTPPIPPRTLMPRPVDVKEVRVRPDGVYLLFTLPSRYVRRGSIDTGIYYRVDRCVGSHCSSVASGREDPGSLVVVRDPDAEEGMFYHYVIRPRVEAKGIPVDVPVKIGPFPSPPRDLKVEAFQGKVVLSWRGEGRFAVYRRVTVGEYSLRPLGVIVGDGYEDLYVDNGVTYHYVVRKWEKKGILVVESAPSKEVVATPMDLEPPPTPQGLTAHYREGALYIAWDPVNAKDLAGYYLYRRVQGGEWSPVVKEALYQPLYVDRDVSPGVNYEYKVVSVDQAGNISEPSPLIKIRIPAEGR